MLAKYGYIEEVPERGGREKPWRLTSPEQDLRSPGPGVEGQLAAEAALEVFLDHETERMKSRIRRAGIEPEPWQPIVSGLTTWLTEAEFVTVKQQLTAVLAQFSTRAGDAAKRPESGREVRLFFAASAAPPPRAS